MELLYWVLVLIGFGFLIFVHELGHFVAAKSVGIRVIRFALGFGPKLIGKTVGDTEYCICLFPFGGYVKMAGGEGEEKPTGAPDEYPSKTPGQRALVVVAGPVMSVLVAIPMLFGLLIGGMQLPTPRVNGVVPGNPAWEAGIKRGDLITGIKRADETNWRNMRLWRDVQFSSELKENNGKIEVRVDRDGEEKIIPLTTTPDGKMGVLWGASGFDHGFVTTTIASVKKIGAAEKAGVVKGSVVLAINGRKVTTWDDVDAVVMANPGKSCELTIKLPSGERRNVNLPILSKEYLSIGFDAYMPNIVQLIRPNFPAQAAGIQPGDRITAVNDIEVKNWPELERALVEAAPGEAALKITRNNENIAVKANLEKGEAASDVLGIGPTQYPIVETSSSKDIQPGMAVIDVKPTDSTSPAISLANVDQIHYKLAWRIKEGERRSVSIVLRDANGRSTVVESPLVVRTMGYLEITPKVDSTRIVPAGHPVAALGQSFVETGHWLKFAAKGIYMLVTGKLSSNMLSGPVMIFAASRSQAEAGFMRFVEFLVIITIHLGFINLLPFPVLDGGHIAFITIEKIRGKPLSDKVMAAILYAGMAFLIGLMLYVTGNDILRLFKAFTGR